MKRFKFTLVAVSYSANGIDIQNLSGQKPFEVILSADDPRIELFRNKAFKETPVEGLAPAASSSETATGDESVDKTVDKTGAGADMPIDTLIGDDVKKQTVDLLKENGHQVVADVLSEGLEGLMAIVGIGKATAEKLMTAATAAVETK